MRLDYVISISYIILVRTLIDLDEKQIRDLDRLAAKAKTSRAFLLRAAVAQFLAGAREGQTKDAFGLWSRQKTDGLTLQRKLRAEW